MKSNNKNDDFFAFCAVIGIVIIFVLIFVLKIGLVYSDDNIRIVYSDKSERKEAIDLFESSNIEIIPSDGSDIINESVSDLGISCKYNSSRLQGITKYVRIHTLNQVLSYYIEDEPTFKGYFYDMNKGLSDSKDAYYEVTDSGLILHKEVYGTKIDIDKLYKDYKKSLKKGIISIDLTEYTVKPKVTKEDLKKSSINNLNNWGITYSNGFSIGFKDIKSFVSISDNSSLVIDDNSLLEYLKSSLKDGLSSYNTVGSEMDFTTSSGESIKVSGGTYGCLIDLDSEVSYVKALIDDRKSEDNRTPIYSLSMDEDLPNTYVEVSIDKQHLWYYVDGSLLMETDIVTGTKGKHDTPRGIYYISEKINGKYLKGSNYKTWVNQWMRLTNQGIGLHDAYWRGKFGGNIYTYKGSHGCINLPKNFAKDLFNSVDRKTVVIVY